MHLGFILASLLFLVVNLTCAMLVHGDVPENQLKWTVFVRALINDSLFILCAISLVSYICKITKMSSANVYLESKVSVFLKFILDSVTSNPYLMNHILMDILYFFKKHSECQVHFWAWKNGHKKLKSIQKLVLTKQWFLNKDTYLEHVVFPMIYILCIGDCN